MAASSLHISISAEKLFSIGNLVITNSIFTSLVVSAILIVFALIVNINLKKTNRPTGLQNFAEFIIQALHDLIHGITGDLKKTRLFFPVISSFFLWILLNNWLGLVPGVGTIRIVENPETITQIEKSIQIENSKEVEESSGLVELAHASETTDNNVEVIKTDEHVEVVAKDEESSNHGPKYIPVFRPGTADLNTTLALAIISIIATQIFGIRYLKLSYFKKFFNFSNPLMTFVGLLELVSEFAKIISFAFRLFGNVFAGEVLLVVMAFLVPLVVPMPFYGLELFVGFIQSLVFAMLSLVFFNMATIGHGDEH
jgi:F-type H+-transporting ATPase subunit a